MLFFNSGFLASFCAALACSSSISTAIAASIPPANQEVRAYSATTTATATPQSQSPDTSSSQHTAAEVIALLNLTASSEKGYYYETFRDEALVPGTNRSASTAIYYLLEGADEFSYWHRVDAAEVWHWYAGARLSLYLAWDDGTPVRELLLGNDLFGDGGNGGLLEGAKQIPQAVVQKGEWQRAKSWGHWTLVGTTVAPAFIPEGFELAPPGWEPNASS